MPSHGSVLTPSCGDDGSQEPISLFTGYVDARNQTIIVMCRSKCADLVDCLAELPTDGPFAGPHGAGSPALRWLQIGGFVVLQSRWSADDNVDAFILPKTDVNIGASTV